MSSSWTNSALLRAKPIRTTDHLWQTIAKSAASSIHKNSYYFKASGYGFN